MSTDNNGSAAVISVPTLVTRALRRCGEQYRQAMRMPHRTHAENARRAERLATIVDREGRWFGVLHRWVYSGEGTVPLVFGPAVIRAEAKTASDARFWAEQAGYYRQRCAGIEPDDGLPERWLS